MDERDGQRARAAPLTSRQLQVLGLYGRGMTYAEIANALGVSAHTISAHMTAIHDELDVASTLQALISVGWLVVPDEIVER